MMKLLLFVMLSITLMAEATVKQLFSVQSVKVKKQNFTKMSKSYGYVKVDESRVYKVTSRFGGYVEKLYVDKTYMKVTKGQRLVEVYSPAVFKAKEEYLNTYKYTQKRPNRGMLESSKLKLKLLGISDKEIRALIKSKKATQMTSIYAPFDGYIFKKSIEKGSAFSEKTELFEIVNLDKVWVEAKVFEEQRKAVKNTKEYLLSFKGISQSYRTSKSFLYPLQDEKEATQTLRLELDNDGQLFPGMYASVQFLSPKEEVLSLVRTAVIRKNGAFYVFVVGDFKGEYEPRKVEVSVLDNNTYKVESGLNEGDEVVNNALFMMDSDAQINGLY